MAKRFTWLHISDLHVGAPTQSTLWPTYQSQLIADLKTVHRRTSHWDAIIFTGDMTFSGERVQFDKLDDILKVILDTTGSLGSNPKLITLPGNHDLRRPNRVAPEAAALKSFWSNGDLRHSLIECENPAYLSFLHDLFSEYTSWRDRMIAAGLHAEPTAVGLMPGDALYNIDSTQAKTSIVALNSTWLQIDGGDFEGGLATYPHQLMKVTDYKPDEIFGERDFTFLATHHPSTWIHKDLLGSWSNEINHPGRFDAHLYGHMHIPEVSSGSFGGSASRRSFQSSSMFGLEYFGEKEERLQGYAVCRAELSEAGRSLSVWPRALIEVGGAVRKIVADVTQDINEDNYLQIHYERNAPHHTNSEQTLLSSTKIEGVIDKKSLDMADFSYHIPDLPAHRRVRTVELRTAIDALEKDNVIWVSSDWGMGEDGFIGAIRHANGHTRAIAIRFVLDDYGTRERFFASVKEHLGVTFTQICDALSDEAASYILFDDIPAGSPADAGEAPIEADVERIAAIVTEFAPTSRIILRSRRHPQNALYQAVHLGNMDEADLAIYLKDSDLGGDRYAKPEALDAIFRHTDGVPSRVDAALRQLEVGSIDDLVLSNVDFASGTLVSVEAPEALAASIEEVAESSDPSLKRSYDLLLALSTLPKGEQLSRLKRFYGPAPIHPSHALELLDRSLIETLAVVSMGEQEDAAVARALVVPRPVRERIREQLEPDLARSLDLKALSLYFGENWKSGEIALSIAKRTADPLCNANEIGNAIVLIARTLNGALASGDDFEVSAAISLGSSYVAALINGDHYRSAVSLCDDILAIVGEGRFQSQMNILRVERLGALRMSGRPQAVRDAFAAIDLEPLSKSQKQDALLDLALAQSTMRDREAAETAKKVVAVDKNSAAALQAQSIQAEFLDDASERRSEFERLLGIADRKKRPLQSENLKLHIAALMAKKDAVGARKLLDDVVKSTRKNKNYYTLARSIIRIAEIRDRSVPVSDRERDDLVEVYHFLYNERISGLFNRCHDILWQVFLDRGEIGNLLNLFRHSSFLWRLNARTDLEQKYLGKMTGIYGNGSSIIVKDKDRLYFMVRVTVVLGQLTEVIGSSIAESDGENMA